MQHTFSQQLGNLPEEILVLPRFLRTRKDNPKAPAGADWQKPEKQKLYSELKGICGFVAATDTEESLLFADFDHAITKDGNFINHKAEFWFNLLTDSGKYFAELSQSTTGAHSFARPTKGKFGKVTGKIYLTEDKKSFIEIFYRTTKFCLVTGNVFRCKPNSPIAQGEVADNMFQAVIAELTAQNSPIKPHVESVKIDKPKFTGNTPTEQERACAMLDKIPVADLSRDEWLNIGMALKNNGNTCADWEQWSRPDTRFKQGECENLWKDFKDKGLTIATIHDTAEKYGYSEHDFQRDWYQQHGTSHKVIHASEPTDDDRQPRTCDTIKDCPVDLVLPNNYLFRNSGITLVVPPKKDGDDPKYICVTRTPIIPTKIFREPTKSKFSYEIAILTRKMWRTVEIEGRTLADPRAIITLADSGALILEPKLTCRFLNDVIALNPDLQEIKAYSQTGWTDDTFKTFAYPRAEGCILRRAGFDFDRDLAKRGDPDLWKEKFIEVSEKGGAIAAMYIGSALAAVLARPLNIMNPQTHVHGTSGGGKTALQKFTASIFGNPRKLIRTFAATNKNRQLVSAAFCDLPTFYDELETLQGKAAEEQLSNDIYNFAEGKGNQANKRDGTARETFEFGGARLTTGERPILKQHDLRGAYKRLIQLDTGKGLLHDVFAADLHIFSESNFGLFGYQWTQYATAHFAEIQKKYQYYATSKNNPTLEIFEPTYLKQVSASLVVFEFFKMMLGITAAFDEDYSFLRNYRAIVDTLPTNADLDDTGRAIDALRSYVSSHEKTFTRDATDTETNKIVEIGVWGTTCSGKIFDTGAVAVHPTELRRILEDELHFASADKLINEWILDGTLITDTGRKTKVVKIGEKTYRAYYFQAGTISTSNDSAESDYYEKLCGAAD